MLEKKYYKQDLCEDAGRCKLYNPLLTQGQCEYYNKMCELIDEEAVYKRALELACRRIDCLMGNEDSEYVTDPFTFKLLAKEELEKGK